MLIDFCNTALPPPNPHVVLWMVLRFHRTGTVEITMVTVTKIIIDQPPVLTVTAETKCCVAVSSIRGSTALESRWVSMATIGQVLSYTGLKNMMPLQWNPGQSFLMPAKPDIATLWSSQVFCDSNIIQPDPAGPKRWTCPSKSSKSATKKRESKQFVSCYGQKDLDSSWMNDNLYMVHEKNFHMS